MEHESQSQPSGDGVADAVEKSRPKVVHQLLTQLVALLHNSY